jgi:tripartite-type tricarboxylate transporter receptor subunit TctC
MLPTPRPIRALVAGLVVPVAVLGVTPAAAAQDAGGFYAGKTITLTIGAARDSDDDRYARLFAKYLPRHLAGKPAVVVANLPASGGHAAAAFIFSAAAKDGTAIGTVPADVIAAPLWFGPGKVAHDPTQFIYLGSAAPESTDCFVRSDTPVMSLRDAFVSEVAVGAAADGGPTRDGPALFNSLLGTKFRILAHYGGVADILAAIEDGEVAGACGVAWTSVATRHPDWLPKGVLRCLVQESLAGADMASADMATRIGIPLVTEFLRSAADREALALAYAEHDFAHPYMLPPGTPPERAAALRKAFMAAWQDAGLAAEAKQASLAVHPVAGEDVGTLVDRLYAAPAESVERLRAALAGEKAH